MSSPWIGSAALVAMVAVLATGCGSTTDTPTADKAATTTPATTTTTTTPTPQAPDISTLAPAAIFAKAKAHALGADSVRMRGTAADLTLDVQLTKTGGQGSFVVEGTPMGIRVIGRTVYLQMTEKFLRATGKREKASAAETEAMVKLMKDKWVKLSKPGDFEVMVTLTTRDSFFKTLFVPSGNCARPPRRPSTGSSRSG